VRSCLPASELSILTTAPRRSGESVRDVQFTLLLSIALVVLVIFVFPPPRHGHHHPEHRDVLSIIGTFAVMHLLGFSLNNLSLMALTLCVGFVVDDAIVVLENIVRHMEKGEKRPWKRPARDRRRSPSPSSR
jgi:HAE1 family hydrophobic/amphiphilic exporter-1